MEHRALAPQKIKRRAKSSDSARRPHILTQRLLTDGLRLTTLIAHLDPATLNGVYDGHGAVIYLELWKNRRNMILHRLPAERLLTDGLRLTTLIPHFNPTPLYCINYSHGAVVNLKL